MAIERAGLNEAFETGIATRAIAVSVRPIATAIYGGADAIGQVWLSIVAPILGAVIAGFIYKAVFDRAAKVSA